MTSPNETLENGPQIPAQTTTRSGRRVRFPEHLRDDYVQ